MIRRTAGFAIATLLSVALPTLAQAHATSTSYLTLDARAERTELRGRLDVAVADLAAEIDFDQDRDEQLTWRELTAAQSAIERYVRGNLRLSRGDAACELAPGEIALTEHVEEIHIAIPLVAQCRRAGLLELRSTLFFERDASQRTLLEMVLDGRQLNSVLSPAHPHWIQTVGASGWTEFARFIGLGASHVGAGYDHLAFLVLLLLPSVLGIARDAARTSVTMRAVALNVLCVVSAFTVAHSLTLSLAATGHLRLPAALVEIAIAASIVLAGLANLLPRLARARLGIAFGFGLIHGCGFANALQDLITSPGARLAALGGFNIGVELGQLLAIAIVLPMLLFIARRSTMYGARLVPAVSLGAAMIGAYWSVSRLAVWP